MSTPSTVHRSPFTFHLIPHTHWDREWYLTRAAFQARLIPVVDEMLEQLEQNPEARFVLDGQTVLLEDYLAVKPENERRIASLVRRGTLEIGPWYVLSDLLIPSAESLRRNLAEGARDAERYGRRLDVLYSPDAFGHPAGLPELAAEFGIRWAVIRRGLRKPLTGDRDLYRWESPGGQSLLVHHLPAGGYDLGMELSSGGDALQHGWSRIRRELIERAATGQIAVFLGADHHAMVRNLAGLKRAIQDLEPGNAVRISGLKEYFEAVERERPKVPTIRGELRRHGGHCWVLPGVHSARSRLKRRHANVELALSMIAEPLGGSGEESLLRVAWRTLLQSQFHDTLAGTTSDAVQQEQEVRLQGVESLFRETATRSLWRLARHDPDRPPGDPDQSDSALVLWNPVGRSRHGIVTAELSFFRRDVLVGPPGGRRARIGKGYQPFVLRSAEGNTIPVQVLAVRPGQERSDAMRRYPDQDEVDRVWVAFRPDGLTGLGTGMLRPVPMRRDPPEEGLETGDGSLTNRFVSVQLLPTGGISLTDLRSGESYSGLCELVDEPDRGDLYTFSAGAAAPLPSEGPVEHAVLARGPLVGTLEARWKMASAGSGQIGVRLLATLHADSALLRLHFEIDNLAWDHRLRARFPIGLRTLATAGAAFGVERRAPVSPRPLDTIEEDVPTAPAHRFVAAAEGRRGLALLQAGCFEYEWTRHGELVATLLRSVGELSRGDLPERPGHAAWPLETPLAQELGQHTLDLVLVPVGEREMAAPDTLLRYWEAAFLPVQAMFLRDYRATNPPGRSIRSS